MVDNDREILLQTIKSLTEQNAALTARIDELTQKFDEKNHKKNSKGVLEAYLLRYDRCRSVLQSG